MTFVHKHKVVLFKAVNRNSFYLALFLELVHVDNNDIFPLRYDTAVFLKHGCGYRRQRKLIQMLPAHPFVGGQDNDFVDGETAVKAAGSLEIMQKL